jgi:S-adenosyl-L-methionine hydrolase (adenosine-forming)
MLLITLLRKMCVMPVFPLKTVFLTVVDPGVGNPNQEKLICVFERQQKIIVAPNNGLATRVIDRYEQDVAYYQINLDAALFQGNMSQTFHGRDIYAPVAGMLAQAMTTKTLSKMLEQLGIALSASAVHKLMLPQFSQPEPGVFQGEVDVIDAYGNVITNIPNQTMSEAIGQRFRLEYSGCQNLLPIPYQSFYSQEQPSSSPLVLVPGSHGKVELASPGGNAQQYLSIHPGTFLCLCLLP